MTDDSTASPLALGELSAERFQDHLEALFILESQGARLTAILVDSRTMPDSAGPDCTRTPFSLLLRAEIDENHPLQTLQEFPARLHGLSDGVIEGLLIQRTLRPARRPSGCYYQIIFN